MYGKRDVVSVYDCPSVDIASGAGFVLFVAAVAAADTTTTAAACSIITNCCELSTHFFSCSFFICLIQTHPLREWLENGPPFAVDAERVFPMSKSYWQAL